MARWRQLTGTIVAATAMTAAACGGTDVGSGTSSTSGAAAIAESVGDGPLAPWCTEVPRPGPIAESDFSKMAIDPTLMGVLNRYHAQHADTYAGLWLDRAHGGTVVLAFTDDPAPHREAIGALVAEPGDPTGVVMAPSTSPDGSVVTTMPPTTTVAESGAVVDVVQVARTEPELQALADEARTAFDDGSVPVVNAGTDIRINRVVIDLGELPTDEVRRTIAERVPVDSVCLSGGPTEAFEIDMPTTMIPAEGTDPWITCSRGSIPIRLSALEDPPELAPDDPLQVAFDKQKDQWSMGHSVTDEWYLLSRMGGHAQFATGYPPAGYISMELEGDRWVATGSGGGTCEPVSLLPDGLAELSWMLDSAYPPPGPDDTTLHLIVNRVDCSSGAPVGDQLVGPEVDERGDQLLVALAVERMPPGSYNCVGTMGEPVEITLPVPLGDRELVDGRYLPPRPVGTGGSSITDGS